MGPERRPGGHRGLGSTQVQMARGVQQVSETCDMGTAPYRGPDRRTRFQVEPPAVELGEIAGLGLAILLLLVFCSAAAVYAGARLATVAGVVHLLASVSGMAAGAALLVCWKISGRALSAWLGIGLIDFGLLSLGNGTLQAMAGHGSISAPYSRLVPCGLAALAIVAAITAPEVDSRMKPLGLLAATGTGGAFVLVALQVAARTQIIPESVDVTTRVACAVVWLLVGAFTLNTRRRNRAAAAPWVPAFLLTLSLAQSLAASLEPLAASTLVADGGLLVAASFALHGALRDLSWMFTRQDRHSHSLRLAADQLRNDLQRERAELDEQLHDLRNAVTGIRNAHTTLRRHAARLDDETRTSLTNSVTAELSRLQALIEPGLTLHIEELALSEVLEPLIAAERNCGTVLRTNLSNRRVRADKASLAQVIQNLLQNARRYAPGATVRVTADEAGDMVRIRVEDDGPGFSVADTDRVFDRGYRGSAAVQESTGSGLGLFIARRLMTEMGGSIDLAPQSRGGCIVVHVPRGRLAQAVHMVGSPSPASVPLHVGVG